MKVLSALLERPSDQHYALEVSDDTELKYGTVQPILVRLEAHGWLESDREPVDPSAVGRSPRRYYRFTEGGRAQARAVLAEAAGLMPAQVQGKLA